MSGREGERKLGDKRSGEEEEAERKIKTLLTGTGRGRGHCAKINDKR